MDCCYVFGAGPMEGDLPQPGPEDFVIAADGGLLYLNERQIVPDLIVGDLDSAKVVPLADNVIRLPEEKDDTDMLAALKEGLARGCKEFHILGGAGGRLDHTLANLQCLAYLETLGVYGYLYDNNTVVTMLSQGSLFFPSMEEGVLSIFAFSEEVTGVYERGLKYTLENATVRNTFPIGVSNAFVGEEAIVSAGKGLLLVIYPSQLQKEMHRERT